LAFFIIFHPQFGTNFPHKYFKLIYYRR
jgi:hypothetical protein